MSTEQFARIAIARRTYTTPHHTTPHVCVCAAVPPFNPSHSVHSHVLFHSPPSLAFGWSLAAACACACAAAASRPPVRAGALHPTAPPSLLLPLPAVDGGRALALVVDGRAMAAVEAEAEALERLQIDVLIYPTPHHTTPHHTTPHHTTPHQRPAATTK